jgi:cell division protein FtsN
VKKQSNNDKSLEAYKIFPYVAWGVTIVFALFVYNITMELKAVTDDLQAQTKALQDQVNRPAHEIEDFGS